MGMEEEEEEEEDELEELFPVFDVPLDDGRMRWRVEPCFEEEDDDDPTMIFLDPLVEDIRCEEVIRVGRFEGVGLDNSPIKLFPSLDVSNAFL